MKPIVPAIVAQRIVQLLPEQLQIIKSLKLGIIMRIFGAVDEKRVNFLLK
jgi:hypothetical protein